MKRAIKIIAVIVGVLVLLVGGFFGWFYVSKVMAPDAQAFCDHTVELMKRAVPDQVARESGKGAKLGEALGQQRIDDFARDCVPRAQRDQERDAVAYAKNAKCALSSKTFDELKSCSDKPKKQ